LYAPRALSGFQLVAQAALVAVVAVVAAAGAGAVVATWTIVVADSVYLAREY
jgi:hypothetical protein